MTRILKIISGGQTGVDRAALDTGLELGIPCGGWCPEGRRAEDGPIDLRYPLRETTSRDYRVRTEKNVKEADGTLILTRGLAGGGTALTIHFAQKHHKPHLVVDLSAETGPEKVRDWIDNNRIRVLNVAGPRETERPGIHSQAVDLLRVLFSLLKNSRKP
jgi:Circularly permutated YpsA SLOG family